MMTALCEMRAAFHCLAEVFHKHYVFPGMISLYVEDLLAVRRNGYAMGADGYFAQPGDMSYLPRRKVEKLYSDSVFRVLIDKVNAVIYYRPVPKVLRMERIQDLKLFATIHGHSPNARSGVL